MIKAFSLIELMVVIAIIGVLATVATPVYTSYIQRVKLASVLDISRDLSYKSTVYYSSQNAFPTLQELGYTTISPTNFTDAAAFAPHISFVSVFPGTATCKTGSVLFYFYGTSSSQGIPDYMPENLGNSSDYNGSGYGIVVAADINGTIQNFCFYNIYDNNNTLTSGDFINGCVNVIDFPNYANELDTLFNSC